MKITNIKFSGCIHPCYERSISKLDVFKFTSSPSRICFRSLLHPKIFFFILGKECNHLNITGVRNLEQIPTLTNVFLQCCVDTYKSKISNFKIDSISLTDKRFVYSYIYKLLKAGNERLREALLNKCWYVRSHLQFPGITIKLSEGPAITFFKSGCITGCGFKSTSCFYKVIKVITAL